MRVLATSLESVIETFNRLVARGLEWLLAAAVLLMSVTLLLQVYYRYIARSALPWSEELSRHLLLFLTSGGTARSPSTAGPTSARAAQREGG